MIACRSIVGRFNAGAEGEIRPAEYLCRETEIFGEEWSWSQDRSAAHVFPTHGEADDRARELTKETGRVCFAIVRKSVVVPATSVPAVTDRSRMEVPATRRFVSAADAEAEWQRRQDA